MQLLDRADPGWSGGERQRAELGEPHLFIYLFILACNRKVMAVFTENT
jgi:hypothetical protein